MQTVRSWLHGALVLAVAALGVAPAEATTLIREGLDDLVAGNATIVLGEVLDASSYWNADGTFMLTDVRIAPHEVLKGEVRDPELVVTLMGGTVGDLTTLIVGGAELVPGNSYLLFLNREDLPGARAVRTVRDHCQGVFEVVRNEGGPRAVSQATRHPLLPDAEGYADAPGGVRGLPLDTLKHLVRELVKNPLTDRPEVQ